MLEINVHGKLIAPAVIIKKWKSSVVQRAVLRKDGVESEGEGGIAAFVIPIRGDTVRSAPNMLCLLLDRVSGANKYFLMLDCCFTFACRSNDERMCDVSRRIIRE
jgi:hypothetical protein